MKNIMKYIGVVIFAGLCSCNDFLDTDMPSSIPYDGELNKLECELLINGVYSTLSTGEDFGLYNIGISISELGTVAASTNAGLNNHNEFENYQLTDDHLIVHAIYRLSYKSIQQANVAIADIGKVDCEKERMAPALKERYIAEAKFIRALSYFNLVRYFGGVPLKLTPTEHMYHYNLPRNSVEDVYAAIIADLEYAKEHLYYKPSSSLEPRYTAADLGRATRTAATALLSKVYLTAASYKKHSHVQIADGNYTPIELNSYEWVNVSDYYVLASNYAKEIIALSDAGAIDVHLNPDYSTLFTTSGENSSESIFEVQFTDAPNLGSRLGGWFGMLGVSEFGRRFTVRPDYVFMHEIGYTNINDTIVPAVAPFYELDPANTDQRVLWNTSFSMLHPKTFVKQAVVENRNLTCLKYNVGGTVPDPNNSEINFPVLRYADVLLMYAEAQNELGNMTEAIQYVNMIRARARQGIHAASTMSEPFYMVNPTSSQPADYTGAMTQEEVREAIILERTLELSFEGHSRHDEIRMGRLVSNAQSHFIYLDPFGQGDTYLAKVANSGGIEALITTDKPLGSQNASNVYQFFPIPKEQRDRNPKLVQNPGW